MASIFCRRIPLVSGPPKDSGLKQRLNLFHLTMNGVSGSNFVMLTVNGILVGRLTGTSAFLSCMLAALISILPGACLVEFASKMPSAGSMYTYTYATIGETAAFLVGLNNMFDLAVQTAVMGKAASVLIDRWSFGAVSNFSLAHFGHLSPGNANATAAEGGRLFGLYPDLLAALLLLTVAAVLLLTVDVSVSVLNALGSTFLVLFLVVIISCFAYGSRANLNEPGKGGIFRHGLPGVTNGTAIIIFAFMFYDAIGYSSEEARRPHKDVLRASCIGLGVITIFLVLSSMSVAFLVPHSQLDVTSPYVSGFQLLGVDWMVHFASSVSLLALSSGALITLFGSTRYLYAMARDGLLPSPLAYLQPSLSSPVASLSCVTVLVLFIAILFDLLLLTEISQVGCVLSFFAIGVDLLIMRYMPFCAPDAALRDSLEFRPFMRRRLGENDNGGEAKAWLRRPAFFIGLLVTEVLCAFFGAIVFAASPTHYDPVLLYFSGALFTAVGLGAFAGLCLYEPNPVAQEAGPGFTVPLLPALPIGAVVLSFVLVTHLPYASWVRFAVVSCIGLVIYFVHSLWRLSHAQRNDYEHITDSHDSDEAAMTRDPIRRTM